MDREAAAAATAVAEQAVLHARELVQALSRTALALDHSASLAEDHARRRSQAGRYRAAEEELRSARRAREASELARAQAERWRELTGDAAN